MSVGVGLLNPKVQFLDDNGDPLANGAAFFSIPGTLIARNTYSDFALTIPNANPVILDAAGRATIYFDPTMAYKLTLLDEEDGNIIYTQDNISEPQILGLISADGSTWLGRVYADSAQIAAIGASLEGHTFRSTLSKAASGTNPIFSGVVMYPPTISGSGATVTVASTLTVAGAPSGAITNYALYVTAGNSLFNGNGSFIGTLLAAGAFTCLSPIQGTELNLGPLSGLNHGMTTVAPTTTFGKLVPHSGVNGGAALVGLSQSDTGISIQAFVTSAIAAPPTTGSQAPIILNASLKSGTTGATLGANKLIAVIQDSGTTRFAFDSDGDSFQDTGSSWTNYDSHDDIAVLDALAVHVSKNDDPYKEAIRRQFAESLTEMLPRSELERMKIVSPGPGSMLNTSKLAMLHTGALRQIGRSLRSISDRLDAIGA